MSNRLIKDTIRTSKKINRISDGDFRAWVYLITYVDDYGRGSADPELLRGMVFPRRKELSEQQIAETLDNLEKAGLIRLYEADGEKYLQFENWSEHQQIRTMKSRYPRPNFEAEAL